MPKLSRIGEFSLIQKIQNWCKKREKIKNSKPYKIIVPTGDDAFVAKLTSNTQLVVTTDTMVEGTHFDLNWKSSYLSLKELWYCLGYKAMAMNLSDCAAMGHVEPLFAFATLGVNGDISVDCVDKLYLGMLQLAQKQQILFAGGDTIRSEKSIISITVVGKLKSSFPITRCGAKVGETIMATGPLGLAYCGLKILNNKEKLKNSSWKSLVYKQLKPEPKLKESEILINKDFLATAMIDTSDDLLTSLEILKEKSSVGFEIQLEKVPIPEVLKNYCLKSHLSPYQILIHGGEDYQLLFTCSPNKVKNIQKKIASSFVLGKVKEKSFGIQFKMGEKTVQFKNLGFQHF
ncbi:MAG: thiamine-phosphate kinase [Elusimicrobia bacterium RIFCSPLOWO2_02_FULL_39_32]|nr:MAG: thiamine-phosphate kinase [Elusimicrobia bacterium GWA2_38_7]OGR80785.1 MAG: thiamine-phosphate kinase [Elusimicrobia bacterium RIFCSPHIGHO2_02_FULL_39_36]OGR93508.1 MAG: thiamine-phosphate kinase [Elusimicrobia bacterium RIFCSPLOWO2_02_FULL_39_32]OGS00854.1 MAG: thiamine-phosphate kinase [Elusimicrobia bacterium RIFCSPLOWO2_12_FULL_39_28]